MSPSFAAIMESADWRDDGFAVTVPETWQQGRTTFGGLSSALALEAARRVGGAGLPPLRSAAISFVGPSSGTVDVSAQILRRGRNATWISARVDAGEAAGTVATFAFMGPVQSAVQLNEQLPPGDIVPLDDAAPIALPSSAPACVRENFEVRFARPRPATREPELCWWVRLTQRSGLHPMSEMLLIGDCLPPGVLPLLTPGVPISTMIWQANLLSAVPTTRDGWWLLRSRGDYAENGCASQQMAVWNSDGEAVMSGMQSIALFG